MKVSKITSPTTGKILIITLLLFAFLLSACGQATPTTEATLDANLVATSAAQTIEAMVASTAQAEFEQATNATETAMVEPTATSEPTLTPTDAPTNTPEATLTPTLTFTPTMTFTPTFTKTPVFTATPSFGVNLSSYSLGNGDSFTVSVYGFPKNVNIDILLGKVGESASVIKDGTTDDKGRAATTMVIPAAALKGDKWSVIITTSDLVTPRTARSAAITIKDPGTNAKVVLSSYNLDAGDNFTVTISGFPANASVDFRLGKQGEAYSVVKDGTTDSTGATATTMTIPASAVKNEKWIVTVLTTDRVNGVTKTASAITITDGSSGSEPKVILSSYSLKASDTFTITVTGFPANASIDFRLGEEGEAYSVVADGTTDSTGAAATTMTIPAGAVKGEKWVVKVLTTDLVSVVSKTSAAITIVD